MPKPPEKWGLLSHVLVSRLLEREPDVKAQCLAYIEGRREPEIVVVGPPSEAERLRCRLDRSRVSMLPTITLRLRKMASGQKRALYIECSAADLATLNEWNNLARTPTIVPGGPPTRHQERLQ